MNIEAVREHCLSLPMATEDSFCESGKPMTGFGDDCLLFRVGNNICACMILDGSNIIDLKCDPDYAIELRDGHSEIEPAWHWNKKYWNQMNVELMDNALLRSIINHSYDGEVKKLTKKVKTQHPEITTIK